MEERERKRTGIGSLKIRYNQVFGYYMEISRTNAHLAPADYERKQTLANAERYTCAELKDYERSVLEADDSHRRDRAAHFRRFAIWLAEQSPRIRQTAMAVAQLDVLVNFARLAAARNYSRPNFPETAKC